MTVQVYGANGQPPPDVDHRPRLGRAQPSLVSAKKQRAHQARRRRPSRRQQAAKQPHRFVAVDQPGARLGRRHARRRPGT